MKGCKEKEQRLIHEICDEMIVRLISYRWLGWGLTSRHYRGHPLHRADTSVCCNKCVLRKRLWELIWHTLVWLAAINTYTQYGLPWGVRLPGHLLLSADAPLWISFLSPYIDTLWLTRRLLIGITILTVTQSSNYPFINGVFIYKAAHVHSGLLTTVIILFTSSQTEDEKYFHLPLVVLTFFKNLK